VAQVIQNISGRNKNPFITVNCGTLPENLLESELFGFVKGAFTGADKDKPGKFAIADGGVIFLDEIGELPLNLQVKLLRVIDEKRFEPIGSNKTINANIRIIAATNKDLSILVNAGKFRSDLYYRLNVVNVKLPLLKDRSEDIDLLTDHFIGHFNAKYHKNISRLSDEVYRFFRSYGFPGNIRELKNMVERAFVFCNDETIKLQHLSSEYKLLFDDIFSYKTKTDAMLHNVEDAIAVNDMSDIKNVEKEIIIEAIKKCHGNKTMAARALKMDKSTLWRKMKKLGLDHLIGRFDAPGKDRFGGQDEAETEKEKLMDALKKNNNNKSEAARFLGINRITFWRKLKKFNLI
jgi:transcriptional regulator with PAS, ATPase and Fis domain